jgi:hypothetical protein
MVAPTLTIALAPPALRTYCVAVAPLAFRVDAPGVETRVRWRFRLRVQLEARLLPSAVSAEPLRTCSCSAPLIQGGHLMLTTTHELRQRVQRWLTSGALFAAPKTSWAGYASPSVVVLVVGGWARMREQPKEREYGFGSHGEHGLEPKVPACLTPWLTSPFRIIPAFERVPQGRQEVLADPTRLM